VTSAEEVVTRAGGGSAGAGGAAASETGGGGTAGVAQVPPLGERALSRSQAAKIAQVESTKSAERVMKSARA